MVLFSLSAQALAAFAALAAATPTHDTPLSFSEWVEHLAASPSTALSPEEALIAAQAPVDTRALNPRAPSCYTNDNLATPQAATFCINRLVASGLPCTGRGQVRLCTWTGAAITAVTTGGVIGAEPCIDVARAAARIVDACAADGKAGGRETAGDFDVHLHWGNWPNVTEGGPTLG